MGRTRLRFKSRALLGCLSEHVEGRAGVDQCGAIRSVREGEAGFWARTEDRPDGDMLRGGERQPLRARMGTAEGVEEPWVG